MSKVGSAPRVDLVSTSSQLRSITQTQTLKETFAAKLPVEIERIKKLRTSVILHVHLYPVALKL